MTYPITPFHVCRNIMICVTALDMYGLCRLVNFIRKTAQELLPPHEDGKADDENTRQEQEMSVAMSVMEKIFMASETGDADGVLQALHESDELLIPVLADDRLLQHLVTEDDWSDDDEDEDEDEDDENGRQRHEENGDDGDDAEAEEEADTQPQRHKERHRERRAARRRNLAGDDAPRYAGSLQEDEEDGDYVKEKLVRENNKLKTKVAQLTVSVKQMQERMQSLILQENNENESHDHTSEQESKKVSNASSSSSLSSSSSSSPTSPLSSSSSLKVDNPYFDSYSERRIHETMLKDKVRTEAYM